MSITQTSSVVALINTMNTESLTANSGQITCG